MTPLECMWPEVGESWVSLKTGPWMAAGPHLPCKLCSRFRHKTFGLPPSLKDPAYCCQPCALMSTLSLYTHILLFSMIYNICATFGSIIRLGQYCRMCFEPLAIYAMSFRPFPTIFNVFRCFYGISDVCSLISDLSLHQLTIYAFPIL